jgi:hypothetical protein
MQRKHVSFHPHGMTNCRATVEWGQTVRPIVSPVWSLAEPLLLAVDFKFEFNNYLRSPLLPINESSAKYETVCNLMVCIYPYFYSYSVGI